MNCQNCENMILEVAKVTEQLYGLRTAVELMREAQQMYRTSIDPQFLPEQTQYRTGRQKEREAVVDLKLAELRGEDRLLQLEAEIDKLTSALKKCLHFIEKGMEVRMMDQWPALQQLLPDVKREAQAALGIEQLPRTC